MPIANDHQGSETGKPDARWTRPADRRAQRDADQSADRRQDRGLDQELEQDLARRAPSALRTPISRVRSVTEIDMIAITPMPPTISAIDEITTSAKNVAWLI